MMFIVIVMVWVCSVQAVISYDDFERELYQNVDVLSCEEGGFGASHKHKAFDQQWIRHQIDNLSSDYQQIFRERHGRSLKKLYRPIELVEQSADDEESSSRREALTMKESSVRSFERAASLVFTRDEDDFEDRALLFSRDGRLLVSTGIQGSSGELDVVNRIVRHESAYLVSSEFYKGVVVWDDRRFSRHWRAACDGLIISIDQEIVNQCTGIHHACNKSPLSFYSVFKYWQHGFVVHDCLGVWDNKIIACSMPSCNELLVAVDNGELMWCLIDPSKHHPLSMRYSYHHVGRLVTACCGISAYKIALYVVDYKEIYCWNVQDSLPQSTLLRSHTKRLIRSIDIHPQAKYFVIVFDNDTIELVSMASSDMVLLRTDGYLAQFDRDGNLVVVSDAHNNRASVRRYYCPLPEDFTFLQEVLYVKALEHKLPFHKVMRDMFQKKIIRRRRAFTS